MIFRISFYLLLVVCNPWAAEIREQVLKSVYLSKVIPFIQWPYSKSNNQPFKVYFVGDCEPYISISNFSEIVKTRNYTILSGPHVPDGLSVDVLYISPRYPNLHHLLQRFQNKPTLVISDISVHEKEGMHILFFLDQARLKMDLSPSAFQASNLLPSHTLLSLGRIRK